MIARTLRLPALIAAAVVAACAIALLATAPEAEAAFPGQNGRIAYASRADAPGSRYEIFTVNPDGTGKRQLTEDSSADNGAPTFSPNGSRIAWSTRGDVWVMRADGSGKTRLTTGGRYFDGSPAFSPDGRRVLFTRVPNPLGSRADLYVKAVSGGAPAERVNVKPGEAYNAVWRPDGRRIAFSYRKPGEDYAEVATARPDGTGLKVLTDYRGDVETATPNWSPDGRRLVYNVFYLADDYMRLVTVAANGTGKRTVFAPRYLFPTNPAFSPDGKKIVFDYEDGADIWTINADGTGLTNVTDTPSNERDETSPDWQPKPVASD